MTALRILGDTVVSRSDYYAAVAAPEGALEGASRLRSAVGAESSGALETTPPPGVTQFVAIGPGKPLTILIREVYTGRHPKAGLFRGNKPMLVTTALKDYAAYAPASRAVNFMEAAVSPRQRLRAPMATSAGTNLVAYSPAVLTDQLQFTVEMSFDRFPEGLFAGLSAAFTAGAAIPLLMPASGYLLAAGSLVKIASDWADALTDGLPAFAKTETIDFDVPGVAPAQADFRVLGHAEHEGLIYDPGRGLVSKTNAVYDGDEPYVIVSLDGAERSKLQDFAPTLATAEQLRRFLTAKNGAETSITALLDGARLANDIRYREQAVRLTAEIAAEPDAVRKAAKEKTLEAVLKNILTPELKPPSA